MKKPFNEDLMQGTLDMLVLRVLRAGPLHGWGIAQRIHVLSSDVLRVEEGSLYPALYRMERRGLIKSEWGISELNRRAKFYRVTSTGRKYYKTQRDKWIQLATVTAIVLDHRFG